MSLTIKGTEVESGGLGVILDDSSVLNLAALQAFLGGVEEKTAKKWATARGSPSLKGRTWIFTGATLRKAIEAQIDGG